VSEIPARRSTIQSASDEIVSSDGDVKDAEGKCEASMTELDRSRRVRTDVPPVDAGVWDSGAVAATDDGAL